jgi:Beta-propeller domains of methanol dehydrogenase type
MKIKILFIVLMITALFLTPVYGQVYYEDALNRVVDYADLMTDDEEFALSDRIAAIAAEYEYDVVIVTTNTLGGKSPMEYADDYYDYTGYGYGSARTGLLFLLSMEDRDWWISTTGYAISAFWDSTLDNIGESMLDDLGAGNYHSAFNTFLTNVESTIDRYVNDWLIHLPEDFDFKVIDDADILVNIEESFIKEDIYDFTIKYNCDFVVLTVDSLEGKTAKQYAEDYYAENGLSENGFLLVMNVAENEFCLLPKGSAAYAVNDYGIDYIINRSLGFFNGEDYYSVADWVIYYADLFLEQAAEGDPFNYDNEFKYKVYKPPISEALGSIGISALAGLILAFIVVSIMKSGMNTIRRQQNAHNYIKKDSLNVLNMRDSFLYSNTTKTKRSSESSSSGGGGGGSSTHSGSSGTSHGGGGGKF